MDINTLLEIIKGNGLAGILIVAVFFYFKFNDFSHVNKTLEKVEKLLDKMEENRNEGHKELTDGFQNINLTLTRIEQYLKDRLNGNNK